MENRLTEEDLNLAYLDYGSLLKVILKALRKDNPFRFSKDGLRLFIDIDKIAYSLATSSDYKIEDPLIGNGYGIKTATTRFKEDYKNKFPKQIREIRDCLTENLESLLKENEHHKDKSIAEYLKFLWTPLTEFQGTVGNNISFNYDFNKEYKGLSKQRLTVRKEENNSPLLKSHRLTIRIEDCKNEFDKQLKDSLENYINLEYKSDDDLQEQFLDTIEDLYNDRNSSKSKWYKLKRLMDVESIAKVQRTAKIKYLEYLLENVIQEPNAIYLEILIDRLKALESYIEDPNLSDGDYEVSYMEESFNLKDIFSLSSAFDSLPIIPIIDGNLGEVRDTDKGELNFSFGLKLKFGRPIQTEDGKSVLDYNLELINPESKIHSESIKDDSQKNKFVRKVLQRAVLYYFVFSGNNPELKDYTIDSDKIYNVRENFIEKVLPILKDSDNSKKEQLLNGIVIGIRKYHREDTVTKLRDLLVKRLKKNTTLGKRSYPIQINVNRSIVDEDSNELTIFSQDFQNDNDKQSLKYISIGDECLNHNSLCHLSGNIEIDEIQYFETSDDDRFTMEYQIGNFPTIPIVVYPKDYKTQEILKNNFHKKKTILFYYYPEKLKQDIFLESESKKAFIYRITFSLLAHLSLKILLDTAIEKLNRKLFIPILRLQLENKDNPRLEESFLRSYFNILSNLINREHRSTSQGFCIKNINRFKLSNGMSSLYSILPKKFKLSDPQSNYHINKLAIITVSSRECDRSWKGNYKISNLMGEIIKIDRQSDNSILIYTSKTMSQHYDSNRIYTNPDILIEEVERLYKDGYRHILYIAKSPYSQQLNLTNTEDDDPLYFMSSAILKNIKGNKDDLTIYPIFFDKYFAVSLKDNLRKSLYIQDVDELAEIFQDKTKKKAIFFNLFNGIKVGKTDRFYNGVISYSTLLNAYDTSILDDQDIRTGLISRDRNEILELLTLFHFSRYEADSQTIQLKLDPYQNIFGDRSVGALSMFPHIKRNTKGKREFNLMAFLNQVEDSLIYYKL